MAKSEQTLQINEIIEEKYVTIDVINNSDEKSISRKIMIKLSGQNKEMQLAYKLPEIEANLSYEMQLSVIADLSDIELIEIN